MYIFSANILIVLCIAWPSCDFNWVCKKVDWKTIACFFVLFDFKWIFVLALYFGWTFCWILIFYSNEEFFMLVYYVPNLCCCFFQPFVSVLFSQRWKNKCQSKTGTVVNQLPHKFLKIWKNIAKIEMMQLKLHFHMPLLFKPFANNVHIFS